MIELEIGAVQPAKLPPANTFEVIINVMHGDGDKYEDSKFRGGYDEVVPKLKLIETFFTMGWNNGCDRQKVKDAIMTAGTQDPFWKSPQEAWDWYQDHIGYDVTTDHQHLASPSDITVWWYDETRVKYAVNIKGMATQRAY